MTICKNHRVMRTQLRRCRQHANTIVCQSHVGHSLPGTTRLAEVEARGALRRRVAGRGFVDVRGRGITGHEPIQRAWARPHVWGAAHVRGSKALFRGRCPSRGRRPALTARPGRRKRRVSTESETVSASDATGVHLGACVRSGRKDGRPASMVSRKFTEPVQRQQLFSLNLRRL